VEFGIRYYVERCAKSQNLFDEHKVNETRYYRKLIEAYREVFPNFVYESLPMTSKHSFAKSNKEQY
jgi:hypothetical protein